MKITPLIESLLVELSPAEVYDKYYKDLNYKNFRNLVSYDPQSKIEGEKVSRLGKYAKLILYLYKLGKIKREDLSKMKEYLEYVYKYHVPLDVNKIEGITDVYNAVKKYMNIDTQDLNVILKSLSNRDYKTLLNGEKWLILQPLTEKAACYLGVGTQWCTSYGPYSLTQEYRDRNNWFTSYNERGPLYIIIDKTHPPSKYQFHFETEQYMNPEDRQIDVKGFIEKNPELRNFFFPSFVRESTPEEMDWEGKHLSLLASEDALEFLKKMTKGTDNKNPLVNAIINKNEEHLNLLIQDDNIKTEIEIGVTSRDDDTTAIRFYLKKISNDTLQEVQNALSCLKSDKSDSYERVYSDFSEGMDNWNEALEPMFKEYHDANEYDVHYGLGTPNYESFKANYLEGFVEDEKIRDEFIDGVVRNSSDSFEENLQDEINSIVAYIDVDYDNEVALNTVNFLKYIMDKEIEKINGNLDEVLEDYVDNSGINVTDYYEAYYNYGTTYPKYKDMQSAVDNYFNGLLENMEATRQCIEYREKFNMIYNRLFKKQSEYENENVYIKINDFKVNCDDGTVNITYYNKKKNKRYTGNVKIDSIPVYATNYELFESYFNFKRHSITEQTEIKELFGISFDARVWNSAITSHLRLARTYIKNKKDPPDLIVKGREYPKEYESFPVDELKVIVNKDWGALGGYDEQTSGYDENRNYHVNLILGPDAGDGTINHELRHAYEDYMKISKDKPGAKHSKEGINFFSGDFGRFMTGTTINYYAPFSILLIALYNTSKLERSAYAETVYDDSGLANRKMTEIRELISYCNADKLKTQNKPETLLEKWNKFKENYRIPIIDKYKNYEDFIDWSCDEIRYKGQKTLKKLGKVKYFSQQNKKEGGK